jgi:signal transduction histidine kinase
MRAAALRPPYAPTASPAGAVPASGRARRGEASRWRTHALILAIWTVVALVSANDSYFVLRLAGRPEGFGRLLALNLQSCWLWAALTPLMIWLSRRFRLDRRQWRSHLGVHAAAAVGIAAFDVCVDALLRPWVSPFPGVPLFTMFLRQLDTNLFAYFMVVATAHAVDYYRLYRERRLAAAELGSQLATAQLQLLKMQLQPHFLFNTLNAIAELVHEDPDAADQMLTRLGSLLRLALDGAGAQEVSLRQELESLEAYLAIERVRFRDRLTIAIDVAPEALEARVPSLLLQPLVENAIRHGTGPRAGRGRIEVVGRRRGAPGAPDASLELEVRDDGRGLPDGGHALREGVGLRNTRERLARLYGDAHDFALRNRVAGGVIVAVTVPFRAAADGAARVTSALAAEEA